MGALKTQVQWGTCAIEFLQEWLSTFGSLLAVPKRSCCLCAAVLLSGTLTLVAADKRKPVAPPAAAEPCTEVQPAAESLDLNMYQRICDEGLNHSHVMEFASALTDGIGARLTGSPNLAKANEWTRDTLRKIGLENAHLEDWGEFGMGWQQVDTWARLVTPDTAVLIVQAAPWSSARSASAKAIWHPFRTAGVEVVDSQD
jgi:carboxypeptidase Q